MAEGVAGTPQQPLPNEPVTLAPVTKMTAPRWPLGPTGGIALAIAAVVIIATAVVLLAGGQGTASYPAGSPEAAFQGYLQAWFDEDYEAAHGYFSERVKRQMTLAEFETEAGFYATGSRQTVVLDRVTGTDPNRTLHLTITDYFGDPSYGGGYSYDQSVRMVLDNGSWRIDEALVGLQTYYGYER